MTPVPRFTLYNNMQHHHLANWYKSKLHQKITGIKIVLICFLLPPLFVSINGSPKSKEFYDVALLLSVYGTFSCIFKDMFLPWYHLEILCSFKNGFKLRFSTIENHDVLTYLDWAVRNFRNLLKQSTLILILGKTFKTTLVWFETLCQTFRYTLYINPSEMTKSDCPRTFWTFFVSNIITTLFINNS